MAEKLKSNSSKQAKQNDGGNGQAGEPKKKSMHDWNSKVLTFEWWEPAPDGFCSSPISKRLRKPKP